MRHPPDLLLTFFTHQKARRHWHCIKTADSGTRPKPISLLLFIPILIGCLTQNYFSSRKKHKRGVCISSIGSISVFFNRHVHCLTTLCDFRTITHNFSVEPQRCGEQMSLYINIVIQCIQNVVLLPENIGLNHPLMFQQEILTYPTHLLGHPKPRLI